MFVVVFFKGQRQLQKSCYNLDLKCVKKYSQWTKICVAKNIVVGVWSKALRFDSSFGEPVKLIYFVSIL